MAIPLIAATDRPSRRKADPKFRGCYKKNKLRRFLCRYANELIGITPFRNMLRQESEQKLPRHILLFYSIRRPEDAAFLEELEEKDDQAKTRLRKTGAG